MICAEFGRSRLCLIAMDDDQRGEDEARIQRNNTIYLCLSMFIKCSSSLSQFISVYIRLVTCYLSLYRAMLQSLVHVPRQSPHADFSSRSGPLLVCLANNISLKVHFEGSDSHGCPPSRSCRGLVMEPLAPYLYKEWS